MSNCHTNGLDSRGSNKDVIFIEYAPSKDENLIFKGSSGQLLNATLKACGWSQEQSYYMTALCKPISKLLLQEQIDCIKRFSKEILSFKPKLIIPIGDEVCNLFFSNRTLGQIRGNVIWSKEHKCYIMPIYSCAQVHYNTKVISDIVRDLSKIKNIVTWGKGIEDDIPFGGSPLAQVKYDIASSTLEAQKYINNLPNDKFIAIDVETHQGKDEDGNIDIYSDRLLSLCIGTEDHALFISADYCTGLVFPENLIYTFHNGMFDKQMILRLLNINIEIKFDTMLASYNLDERSGHHRLKSLAREYLGSGFYEENLHEKNKSMATVPVEKLAMYNAKDVIYTARLAKIFNQRMIDDNVINAFYNILIPAANMFAEIQYRGVHIDQALVTYFGIQWGQRYLEEEALLNIEAIKRGWDKSEINLGSPKQLGRLLFDIMKLPGGPSTKKEVLEELAQVDPFCGRLIGLRHLYHTISHYIIGVQKNVKNDMRVHPVANIHGSETGRLSYNEPPVQTIPNPLIVDTFTLINNLIKEYYPTYKVIDDLEKIRGIFNVSSDDYWFVEADYGKAELWRAAYESGDHQMIDDLLSGDFHSNAASDYFRVQKSQVSDKQRQDGKPVTFGMLYGRGPRAIQSTQLKDLLLPTVDLMCQGFKLRYKQFFRWVHKMHAIAKSEGEVQTSTGRKRRYHIIGGDKEYHQLNGVISALIQGPASDITLSAAINLHNKFKNLKSYILFLVHDAILFEVHKDSLKESLVTIREEMLRPQFTDYPVTEVDIKIGKRWGTSRKIKFTDGEPDLSWVNSI